MSAVRPAPAALLAVLVAVVTSLGLRGVLAGGDDERGGTIGDPVGGGAPTAGGSPIAGEDREGLHRSTGRFLTLAPDEATGTSDPALERRVDEVLERWLLRARELDPRARPVRVALHVVDLESGREVLARNADLPLRPASNMKLVTTAAAQVLFGPDGEFVTRVERRGELAGGVLDGDLVARAGGDPVYREDEQGRVEERLDELVRALREAGIREVGGDVLLDEGRWPEPGPGPEWPPPAQFWQESCALAGGFSVNAGVLVARVEPRAPGQNATIEVRPAPHGLDKRYGVETVARRVNDVRVGASVSAVTVRGSLGASLGPVEARFAHPDPVDHFASVLADRLARGGVLVRGAVRRRRGVPPGAAVAELRSSIPAVLGPINRLSVNALADQLFLALGAVHGGSPDRIGGYRAVRRALAELGVPGEGLVQVDGSGLSRANRTTARHLTRLVRAALARDVNGVFRDSLAVGGVSGTLEDRMQGPERGRVAAKSGWIRGTSALSGVVQTDAGGEAVFSVLVEYPPECSGLNTKVFKPMQDELVRTWLQELR